MQLFLGIKTKEITINRDLFPVLRVGGMEDPPEPAKPCRPNGTPSVALRGNRSLVVRGPAGLGVDQIGVHEAIQVSVQHPVNIAHFRLAAQIFD